jgi:hypothetical protein
MELSKIKIGLTADLFDTSGHPLFGTSPLSLFSDAGLKWDILPPDGGRMTPGALAGYDALFIGGSRPAAEKWRGIS